MHLCWWVLSICGLQWTGARQTTAVSLVGTLCRIIYQHQQHRVTGLHITAGLCRLITSVSSLAPDVNCWLQTSDTFMCEPKLGWVTRSFAVTGPCVWNMLPTPLHYISVFLVLQYVVTTHMLAFNIVRCPCSDFWYVTVPYQLLYYYYYYYYYYLVDDCVHFKHLLKAHLFDWVA